MSTVGLVPAIDRLAGRGDPGHAGAVAARAGRRAARRAGADQHAVEGRRGAGRGPPLLRDDRAPGLDRVRPDPGHQRPGLAGRPARHRAQPARPRLGARQPDPAEPDARARSGPRATPASSTSSSAGCARTASRPRSATRAGGTSTAPAASSPPRQCRKQTCRSSFPRATGLAKGYDVAQVDAFLDARPEWRGDARPRSGRSASTWSAAATTSRPSTRPWTGSRTRPGGASATPTRPGSGSRGFYDLVTGHARTLRARLDRPHGDRFPRAAALTAAYDVQAVDELCDQLAEYFDGQLAMAPDQVRTISFRGRRGSRGLRRGQRRPLPRPGRRDHDPGQLSGSLLPQRDRLPARLVGELARADLGVARRARRTLEPGVAAQAVQPHQRPSAARRRPASTCASSRPPDALARDGSWPTTSAWT